MCVCVYMYVYIYIYIYIYTHFIYVYIHFSFSFSKVIAHNQAFVSLFLVTSFSVSLFDIFFPSEYVIVLLNQERVSAMSVEVNAVSNVVHR